MQCDTNNYKQRKVDKSQFQAEGIGKQIIGKPHLRPDDFREDYGSYKQQYIHLLPAKLLMR